MPHLIRCMIMFWVSIAVVLSISSGCATLVKPRHQGVMFNSNKRAIKLFAYNQKIELQNGPNLVYFERRRADYHVLLRCSPQSKPQLIYLSAHPGGWFLWGNLALTLFTGVGLMGYFIDSITEKGWNIQKTMNLASYCQ